MENKDTEKQQPKENKDARREEIKKIIVENMGTRFTIIDNKQVLLHDLTAKKILAWHEQQVAEELDNFAIYLMENFKIDNLDILDQPKGRWTVLDVRKWVSKYIADKQKGKTDE